jgi:hypothetical protein
MIALEARQGEALARVLLPNVLAAGGLLGRGVEIWCSLDLPESVHDNMTAFLGLFSWPCSRA